MYIVVKEQVGAFQVTEQVVATVRVSDFAIPTLANIHIAAEKTTLDNQDEFGIVDSLVSYVFKKITWANIKTSIGSALGLIIAGLPSKSVVADNDTFVIDEVNAFHASKRITWTNLKTALLTYFFDYFVPLSRTITTTSPLYIDGVGSANLSADRVLSIIAATASNAGSMSAADKAKLDSWGVLTPFTTTISASSGAFTTVGYDNAYYVNMGKLAWWTIHIVITNKGTATGELNFTIPFTASSPSIGLGREDAATGSLLQAFMGGGTNAYRVVSYAGGSMIVNGYSLWINGWVYHT